MEHPWDNYQIYLSDMNNINEIYFHMLKISNTLNTHFKIKKDIRFWKILIGPWFTAL